MRPEMESPACGVRGDPADVEAGASNWPDHMVALRISQATRLVRRCPVTLSMAWTLAPLLYGEAANA